jgi:hypothetical protein
MFTAADAETRMCGPVKAKLLFAPDASDGARTSNAPHASTTKKVQLSHQLRLRPRTDIPRL